MSITKTTLKEIRFYLKLYCGKCFESEFFIDTPKYFIFYRLCTYIKYRILLAKKTKNNIPLGNLVNIICNIYNVTSHFV